MKPQVVVQVGVTWPERLREASPGLLYKVDRNSVKPLIQKMNPRLRWIFEGRLEPLNRANFLSSCGGHLVGRSGFPSRGTHGQPGAQGLDVCDESLGARSQCADPTPHPVGG